MTEMMKRYEAETGECATWTWHEREFLTDDYITWLESQLRWRPVSGELPKEGVDILIMDSKQTLIAERIGQFFTHDGISIRAEFFTHWLPIPPAPEGE